MSVMSKVCPKCGAGFETPYVRKKYCGPSCAQAAKREAWQRRDANRVRPAGEWACRGCGAVFTPNIRRRWYCSDECAAKARRESERRYKRRYYRRAKRLSAHYWELGPRMRAYLREQERKRKEFNRIRAKARLRRFKENQEYALQLRLKAIRAGVMKPGQTALRPFPQVPRPMAKMGFLL